MKPLRANEKGMTLVELLAAITILSIVLVAILSILPQMTASNKQTEQKLETMNLARVELNKLQQAESNEVFLKDNEYKIIDRVSLSHTVLSKEQRGYVYEITHYEIPDLGQSEDTPEMPEELIELYQIHIVIKDGDKVISETFGYVPYEVVGTDVN